MTALRPGDPAPALVITTPDGEIRIEAPGRSMQPTVLAFFKAECATSRLTLPYLERLYQTYASENWRLLGISQNDPETTQNLRQSLGLSFPIAIDYAFQSSMAYRLTHVPTWFLIDPHGIIRKISVGFAREDLEFLSQQIAQHLGQQPIPITQNGDPAFRPG